MSGNDFLNSIKHAAVSMHLAEDEPESATTPAPVASTPAAPAFASGNGGAAVAPAYSQPAYTPPPPGTSSLSALASAVTSSASSPAVDKIYQMLLAKTDFDSTSIAQTMEQYLTPLASLGLQPGQQFKAALNQAKAHENIDENTILGVFETLKDTLASLASGLQDKAAQFEQTQIATRQQRLDEIAQQLTELQTEQAQVAAELTDAQTKASQTAAAVTAAVARRGADIDNKKAEITRLMQ